MIPGVNVHSAKWPLLAAFAFVLCAGLPLPVSPVKAHGAYESSVPAENEVIAESPEVVDVYFSQELRRSGDLPDLFIVNESGDTVSTESLLDDEDRTHVAITLPPALPNGRYTVIWHTLSDQDGEEASGAFHFYVGAGPSGGEPPEPTASPVPGDATPTPLPTEPPSAGDDDSDGVSLWGLIVGILVAAVVAGGAGLLIGRSSGG